MKANEFENHSIYEKIDQLSSRLNDDEVKEKITLDYLDFYITALDYINNKLKITIPVLTLDSDLNTISQEFANALGQINNFIGNNNSGHLNNANSHINSALNRAKNLPVPYSKGDFNFSKVISNFEDTLKQKQDSLDEKNKEFYSKLTQIEAELVKKDERITDLNNIIKQKEQEIQNLNSQFQTEFNTIKTSVQQSFEQDRKSYREEIDSDRKDIQDTTSDIIKELETKLEEAEKLVNVIGNVGATGNFKLIASSHRKSANIFRMVAIFFMLILSAILIYTVWDISVNQIEWTKSIIRIIAAAALSYPATYAASESSKHRKQENYNRKIELELASINPFIAILDKEKQQEIKEKLVEKYFGNHSNFVSKENHDEDEIPVSTFERILKSASHFLIRK